MHLLEILERVMSSLVYDISKISFKEAVELYRCLISNKENDSELVKKNLTSLVEQRLMEFEVGEEVTMKWKYSESDDEKDDTLRNCNYVDESDMGYILSHLIVESEDTLLANHLYSILKDQCEVGELKSLLHFMLHENLLDLIKDWMRDDIPSEYIWILDKFEECEFTKEDWTDLFESAIVQKDSWLVKILLEDFRHWSVDSSEISKLAKRYFPGPEIRVYKYLLEASL